MWEVHLAQIEGTPRKRQSLTKDEHQQLQKSPRDQLAELDARVRQLKIQNAKLELALQGIENKLLRSVEKCQDVFSVNFFKLDYVISITSTAF